jgi:hypothetical protein
MEDKKDKTRIIIINKYGEYFISENSSDLNIHEMMSLFARLLMAVGFSEKNITEYIEDQIYSKMIQ